MKAQCHANELFAINRAENNEYCFQLNILSMQREKKSILEIKIPTQYIHFWIGDPVTLGKLLPKSR